MKYYMVSETENIRSTYSRFICKVKDDLFTDMLTWNTTTELWQPVEVQQQAKAPFSIMHEHWIIKELSEEDMEQFIAEHFTDIL